jgi:UDP-N-acetylmuramate dehydrogenase
MEGFINYVETYHLGEISVNQSFRNLTTLRIGGPIAAVFYPYSKESLKEAYAYITDHKIPYFVIGGGSNLLASDAPYEGVVISLKKIRNFKWLDDETIHLEAGVYASAIGRYISSLGLEGGEFMSVIPGMIGGLICMNAGAYHREIKDVLIEAEYLSEEGEIVTTKDCGFKYRDSMFRHMSVIILGGTFRFKKSDNLEEIKRKLEFYFKNKKDHQPIDKRSAGSTFQNPSDIKAWEIIDQLGLRGYQIGDAKVSEKHANFLINDGNASFDDMLRLVQKIQHEALEKFKINLKCEWVIRK